MREPPDAAVQVEVLQPQPSQAVQVHQDLTNKKTVLVQVEVLQSQISQAVQIHRNPTRKKIRKTVLVQVEVQYCSPSPARLYKYIRI